MASTFVIHRVVSATLGPRRAHHWEGEGDYFPSKSHGTDRKVKKKVSYQLGFRTH